MCYVAYKQLEGRSERVGSCSILAVKEDFIRLYNVLCTESLERPYSTREVSEKVTNRSYHPLGRNAYTNEVRRDSHQAHLLYGKA